MRADIGCPEGAVLESVLVSQPFHLAVPCLCLFVELGTLDDMICVM